MDFLIPTAGGGGSGLGENALPGPASFPWWKGLLIGADVVPGPGRNPWWKVLGFGKEYASGFLSFSLAEWFWVWDGICFAAPVGTSGGTGGMRLRVPVVPPGGRV